MKDYNKSKESLYLKFWDVNNLKGWAVSQKLSVSKFELIEDFSPINEDFIKHYNWESDEGWKWWKWESILWTITWDS